MDEIFREACMLLENKENLFDTLMQAMGDGLSIQDLNMRIVFQNKFMKEQFGEHTGSFCYEIYEKRDTICDGCPALEALKDGKTHQALRIGVTQDGSHFRFENIASVLRNEDGKIVASLELCRIVEERERIKDELEKNRNELKNRLDSIEKLNKFMIGRELRMKQLKEEIRNLHNELNQLRDNKEK
jgi:hypothetical protein